MDKIIQQEIKELIFTSDMLIEEASTSHSWLGHESIEELTSISVRGGQLIDRLYGPESQYAKMYQSVLETKNFTHSKPNNTYNQPPGPWAT